MFQNYFFNLIFILIFTNFRYCFIPRTFDFNKFEQSKKLEQEKKYWLENGQQILFDHINKRYFTNSAKNIILFLGDGMSIPTISAARVFYGQLNGEQGESSKLSFEQFPFTGLAKTYCLDKQVADSACTATAYLCGIKSNYETIGVSGKVKLGDCLAMTNTSNYVDSIAKWAQDAGKSTGIVTTSRVTHASPAGTYAHAANRNWECDRDVLYAGQNPKFCPDIAAQLIRNRPGKNFNVILGGGRREFLPKNQRDEENEYGHREDGVNLIEEWILDKLKFEKNYQYIWNRTDLLNVNTKEIDYLLGLFESNHLKYHLEENNYQEPTLEEMTKIALNILSKNPNGYFLFVEGAKIDMAHHNAQARRALDETVEFSKAIEFANQSTDIIDTLIVVTSDHAHTMSYSGYPERGNNILAYAGHDDNNKWYTTLSYANGPNTSSNDINSNEYRYPSRIPMVAETHGGDDVAVFARGPWAQLFTGVYEQHVIPHLMAFASCIGNGLTICNTNII